MYFCWQNYTLVLKSAKKLVFVYEEHHVDRYLPSYVANASDVRLF